MRIKDQIEEKIKAAIDDKEKKSQNRRISVAQ